MPPFNFEDSVLRQLADLAGKVDDIRVTHLPQMKLDVQTAIADVRLDMQKALTALKVDVGGLKIKAAIAGGMAGIIGTGIVSIVLYHFGIH